MGASTIKYGLSPNVMVKNLNYEDGEIINVACNAATPIHNYYLFKSIENNLDSLEFVLYGIDPWIFSEYYYQYDSLMPVNFNLKQRLFFFRHGRRREALFGGEFYFVIKNILINFTKKLIDNSIYEIPKDFGADKLVSEYRENELFLPKNWFFYDTFSFSNIQLKYLKKIKDEIESKGIKFIILIPPKAKLWREDYENNCNDINKIFIDSLNRNLGEIYTIGSFDLLPENFEKNLMCDYMHLNSEGEIYFSEFISSFLKKFDSISKLKIKKL